MLTYYLNVVSAWKPDNKEGIKMRLARNHFQFALSLAMLFISNQSLASGLSYSYIEVDYLDSSVDVDGTNVDGNGYLFYASTDIASNLALFFGYEDQDYDFDIKGKATSLGIDYHTPISATGDLVISFTVVDVEVSQPAVGSEDDQGSGIAIGFRNQNSKGAEVGIFVSRVDVFDDQETSLALNLGFGATDNIQINLGFNLSDDANVTALGIRAYY